MPQYQMTIGGIRIGLLIVINFCSLIKGIVGDIGENGEEYYVWTHKKLEIGYNGNKIVDVNLTSESKVKLTPNAKIVFTYEVKFVHRFS